MSDLSAAQRRRPSPAAIDVARWIALVGATFGACSIGIAQDAGDPDPNSPPPAEQRAASNQSVSIDMPLPDSAAAVTLPDAGSQQQTDAAPQENDQAVPATDATAPRTIRRREARDPEAALLGERSIPWYRTGVGALSLVLALVGSVFFLARKYVPSIRAVDGGVLRVVTRTSLTSKQSLALIQLGRRFVMVAVSPTRVDVLSEISDPDEVADLTARTGAGTPDGIQTFDTLLSKETTSFNRMSTEDPEVPDQAVGSARRRSSGPVADLLTRLRSLQRSN